MVVEKTYWNQAYLSGEFKQKWNYEAASQELVGVLAALNIAKKALALDLGCGSGTDACYLEEIGFRAVGTDFSHEALKIAQGKSNHKALNASWVAADSCSLPFRSEVFDLISDRCCLHHIDHPARPNYAQEVSRVLKPGGYVLIRGSRSLDYDPFVPILAEELRELFPEPLFTHGPLLPLELANAAGKLTACMIIIRKRQL